jgi:hypothetical protein
MHAVARWLHRKYCSRRQINLVSFPGQKITGKLTAKHLNHVRHNTKIPIISHFTFHEKNCWKFTAHENTLLYQIQTLEKL